MTLVVSWTRKTKTGRELWLMSDSRLSGGKFWDYGPKIFGAGRSDAMIAFAGDTNWTYPLIAQVTSYIESFVNIRDRTIDVADAFDKTIELLNDSLKHVSNAVDPGLKCPECSFIFAGYSSRRQDFFLRRIVFSKKGKKFEGRLAQRIGSQLITYIGDTRPVGALARALSDVKVALESKSLSMEPAAAFFGILNSKKYSEIGGAPQVAKIFQHMSQKHIAVYWPPNIPQSEQSIYLRGRQLKSYDALDYPWTYDAEQCRLFYQDFSPMARRENSIDSDVKPMSYQEVQDVENDGQNSF